MGGRWGGQKSNSRRVPHYAVKIGVLQDQSQNPLDEGSECLQGGSLKTMVRNQEAVEQVGPLIVVHGHHRGVCLVEY